MGQCALGKSAKTSNILGDVVPPGTSEMSKTGPSLDYTMMISNIKLKDVPYNNVSGRISVGHISEINLPRRS